MFLCSAIHTYSDGAAIGSSLGFSFQGHFDMQPAPGIKHSTLQLVAEVLSLLWKNFLFIPSVEIPKHRRALWKCIDWKLYLISYLKESEVELDSHKHSKVKALRSLLSWDFSQAVLIIASFCVNSFVLTDRGPHLVFIFQIYAVV